MCVTCSALALCIWIATATIRPHRAHDTFAYYDLSISSSYGSSDRILSRNSLLLFTHTSCDDNKFLRKRVFLTYSICSCLSIVFAVPRVTHHNNIFFSSLVSVLIRIFTSFNNHLCRHRWRDRDQAKSSVCCAVCILDLFFYFLNECQSLTFSPLNATIK